MFNSVASQPYINNFSLILFSYLNDDLNSDLTNFLLLNIIILDIF
jgi:hypothetical protein